MAYEEDLRTFIRNSFEKRPPRALGESATPIRWEELVNLVSHHTVGKKETLYELSPQEGKALYRQLVETVGNEHDDVFVEEVTQAKESGNSYYIVGSKHEHPNPIFARAIIASTATGEIQPQISHISLGRQAYLLPRDGLHVLPSQRSRR